ncbi:MAG: urea ABC transporter permease subunit UrtB [Campylobacteraceae bacterium]
MRLIKILLLNLLMITFCFSNSSFEDESKELISANFINKELIINKLSQDYKDDKKVENLLTNMLAGNLYSLSDSLVYEEKSKYFDLSGVELLHVNIDELKKITINNKLRGTIRSNLVVINLTSSDDKVRLKAAKDLLANINEDSLALIETALKSEKNSKVSDVLHEGLDILNAKYLTGEKQLDAINNLGDYLSPQALQVLNELKDSSDEAVKNAAIESITSIEHSKKFYSFLETFFFGLSAGSVLLLAAMGLAITFGVMKVINMAHGELIMLGAYTTYTVQQLMPNFIGASIIVSIPLAFLVSALVGILIERLVIRHLYKRPLEALLATFGISLILQQLVRSIYSPLNKEVKTPEWLSGSLEINNVLSLTYNRLYIIIFALIVFAFLLFVMKKTSLGLKVRAVSQNRNMAKAMGIKTEWIDALTFGIGSGIAGVAGVALSQLTNVGPNLGQAYIVDSFMVVVFGGVGNLWGTLIAALSLGEISKIIEPISGAVLAKVLILIFVIIFIQKRPRGLFPQKGRDAED